MIHPETIVHRHPDADRDPAPDRIPEPAISRRARPGVSRWIVGAAILLTVLVGLAVFL